MTPDGQAEQVGCRQTAESGTQRRRRRRRRRLRRQRPLLFRSKETAVGRIQLHGHQRRLVVLNGLGGGARQRVPGRRSLGMGTRLHAGGRRGLTIVAKRREASGQQNRGWSRNGCDIRVHGQVNRRSRSCNRAANARQSRSWAGATLRTEEDRERRPESGARHTGQRMAMVRS